MTPIPFIPETAPFNAEQRAWLNGFLAGLLAGATANEPASQSVLPAAKVEPLLILFGSQTGTAEGLAKRVSREAQKRGFAPRVLALNDYGQAKLTEPARALIISSTWGDGDPPDNAANFLSWLNGEAAPRLEHLQYAVLGLGDKNYPDFCGASKKFDARLEALGAKRLAPLAECDVDYEATANAWIENLWGQLRRRSETGSGDRTAPNHGAVNQTFPTNGVSHELLIRFGKTNPFPARLLKNVLLSKPGSDKEVRHYEISLEGSDLTYEAGDALGVIPANCPALVEDFLSALGCNGEDNVPAGDANMPLREALTFRFDITKPSQALIAAVAKAAPRCELAPLLASERQQDLKRWLWGRDLLDLLKLLPSPLPVEELLALLRKLAPRLYSIASSPRAHPGEVHITVGAVRYECHNRKRKGVASTFLADRVGETEHLKVFVQPSRTFKPPRNGDQPMIMVGPGTGIAPFRAFLEERHATGARGANWLLYGDQKRSTDFLYEEQLMAWQRDGFLTRLDLAFSRDQSDKIYVQHRMMENASEVWKWLEAGAHFYVCGDASRMAKDVDATLHEIIQQAGSMSAAEAKTYVDELKSANRYQRDVY